MQKIIKSSFSLIITAFLLILNVNPLLAEEDAFTRHPNLDYVAINNEEAELNEDGDIEVHNQDTVKISGIGNPNDNISIYILDQEYSATVDENGNWFVLFSIQNLEERSHEIKIKVGEKDIEDLFALSVVKDENAKITLDDEQKVDDEKFEIKYIFLIILIPALLLGGWFLGSYSERKKGSNKNND